MQRSYFDGGLLSLIVLSFIALAITVCSFGILTPWAMCLFYGWKTRHTVIEGRRLKFTGSAIGLFGNWIKWYLLTIVTFGIYGFWVGIKLEQWKVKHTTFSN